MTGVTTVLLVVLWLLVVIPLAAAVWFLYVVWVFDCLLPWLARRIQ